jgi:hypothetical protein
MGTLSYTASYPNEVAAGLAQNPLYTAPGPPMPDGATSTMMLVTVTPTSITYADGLDEAALLADVQSLDKAPPEVPPEVEPSA